MKLELGYINIRDIQFGQASKVENGVLYVDAEAVKKLVLEDTQIASVEVDLARPGEKVRITPVKDVIEPRVKVEGPGGMFPGIISKVETVGSGKTNVLRGAAAAEAEMDALGRQSLLLRPEFCKESGDRAGPGTVGAVDEGVSGQGGRGVGRGDPCGAPGTV